MVVLNFNIPIANGNSIFEFDAVIRESHRSEKLWVWNLGIFEYGICAFWYWNQFSSIEPWVSDPKRINFFHQNIGFEIVWKWSHLTSLLNAKVQLKFASLAIRLIMQNILFYAGRQREMLLALSAKESKLIFIETYCVYHLTRSIGIDLL